MQLLNRSSPTLSWTLGLRGGGFVAERETKDPRLPAKMGKRPVRLRHLVNVVAFFDGITLTGSGIP